MGGLCASSVCSLAQVAGCWARICLDGLQSDTLSGMDSVSELLLTVRWGRILRSMVELFDPGRFPSEDQCLLVDYKEELPKTE